MRHPRSYRLPIIVVLIHALLMSHFACGQLRNATLLVFTGAHLEQALDIWALTRYLVNSRGYRAIVLAPDSLAPDLQDSFEGSSSIIANNQECSIEATTLMTYPSVTFEEYQKHGNSPIAEVTSVLDFHLANCASLLLNRTTLETLTKIGFDVMLGIATDPCSNLLADKLQIRRRAAYDDGSATSLLWGVLLGAGHHTSHVAAYGTGLGGGAMSLTARVRNVIAYAQLQMWRRRVYVPRLEAFRKRHRLRAPPMPPLGDAAGGGGGGGGGGGTGGMSAAGGVADTCHLRGQVIITGADWGVLEPQPLPPAVKLVGPLRAAGPSGADLSPPELAAHVAAATRGVIVISFPQQYRLPMRALLAIAEAVIDQRQHIVWQAGSAEIARVRQLYLPLKHARHILLLPSLPLADLMAHPNVVALITAGSVQALYQAIVAAKPVMAVPLSPVQSDLVARLGALGAGQGLSRSELEGGAASYRVSVGIERMSNVYAFTQSMQLLSTQLRATHGSNPAATALERAAAWVDYTASLDEWGRQYLMPRSAVAGVGAATAGWGRGGGGEPAAGGGGGCMGVMEAANVAAYGILVAAGVGTAALVALVVHVCTRVPSVSGTAAAGQRGGGAGGWRRSSVERVKEE